MTSARESGSTWSSTTKMNLAMLSYATGITIPKVASPWLLETKVGILLLIPVQLVITSIITIPCLFMELALGQYSNRATIKIWDLCPALRGIGLCSFATFLLYQAYCNFLCTCALCFTMLSFTNEKHWKSCNNSWNTINCYNLRDNYTRRMECNQKFSTEKCDKMQWQSSIEQFYFNRILNMDEVSGDVGSPQRELLLYAFITVLIVFIANWDGPKSTEKFVIALTIVPTLQLIILFFVPFTNYNAFVTLNYFFTHFDKKPLGYFKTWTTIIDLCLSTPGLGFGAYITFGTHCSFRSPLHLKAIVTGLVNVLFTVLYSVTLQNFLISLCLKSKILIDEFLNLDQELEMPEAVFFLEHSPKFWMIMWLSNSYMLGLRSLIVMVTLNAEILYSSIPEARKRHNFCVLFFCIMIYSAGFFFVTRIGHLVVKTIAKVVTHFSVLFLTIFQLVGVVYIYGIRKFRDDVYFMLGIKPSVYFLALYILNPIFLGSVLVYKLYELYTKEVHFRFKSLYYLEYILLWLVPTFVISYFLFYIITLCTKKDLRVFRPKHDWGPRYVELATSRKMFKAYNMAREYLYRRKRFRHQFEETEV